MSLTIEQLQTIQQLLKQDETAIANLDKCLCNKELQGPERLEIILCKCVLNHAASTNVPLIEAVDQHMAELNEFLVQNQQKNIVPLIFSSMN